LASKTWDWEVGVGFMDQEYNVFDGAHVGNNCTDIDKAQFSYSAAVFLQGAAFMYNYVGQIWGLPFLPKLKLC
jgi:mannan endo-1,6-alpha-mannosidase